MEMKNASPEGLKGAEFKETALFAEMFGALSSVQRLEIVRLLIRAGSEGMTVGDIQSKLEIPNSTLSHHLDRLRIEGFLNMRRDRQWIWYSVNVEVIGRLVSFLCARCYKPERLGPLLNQIRSECEERPKKRTSRKRMKEK